MRPPNHFKSSVQKQYKTLNDYVENRTGYFQKLCDHFTLPNIKLLDWRKPEDYEKCKELFNRILYYGKYQTWCRDYGLPDIEPPIFINNLWMKWRKLLEMITLL